MKKNLKLLSGILMASFISNSAVSSLNINNANARVSRPVVVNNSSSSSDEESGDEILDEELTDEELTDEELTDEVIDEEEESQTTNILEILNSNEDLTVEEIAELALSVSHSTDFIDEFKTNFPDFNPLRQITPIDADLHTYLDLNNEEIKKVSEPLNKNSGDEYAYSDQNKCNVLIKEISKNLEELNENIKEELPSTIFSLMPTMMVFNDTFKVLSLEYSSILESNFKNQVTLNILLNDLEPKLSSLLKTMNEFKNQLPDLIESLNELVGDLTQGDEELTDEEVTDEELTDEEVTDEEFVEEDVTDEEVTDEEFVEEDVTDEEVTDEEFVEEDVTDEEVVEETTDEEIDPTQVILYFGDIGQELIYDEAEDKYYQLDPENPDSEELIEYSGEVTSMTLADYLNMDLYFDSEGNELIHDADTDSFLKFNEETGEYSIYDGEVTSIKMGDYLEQLE